MDRRQVSMRDALIQQLLMGRFVAYPEITRREAEKVAIDVLFEVEFKSLNIAVSTLKQRSNDLLDNLIIV